MKKEDVARELREVNAILDAFEDGWPTRPPNRRSPNLEVRVDAGVAEKHAAAIKLGAERLVASLQHGWDVAIHIVVWGGIDAGAFIQVYFNGVSPGKSGVRVFNSDLGVSSKSFVPALRACVSAWPAEVDRLIEKFKAYPFDAFSSRHYNRLCARRRLLNKAWFNRFGGNEPGVAYPRVSRPDL